ncbi:MULTISPECIES: aromatic-ring-hydroxylating dioxygenase subunit beta [Ralstonia solanacearum species complex]|uniref:aromatic-ring-hydroxylating dioxygenase subunit beta n=1 Tax=Ralstonia solanacearum species complex TaxID=3116862 RepID=UPI0018D1ADCD|nr:nuclear transport factor 2 family protein [Ralstonia pseudosolanacearum]UWD92307.1 nuclear transport factor 2 family protein [Ralstonia pseudosolanacearum]CAH0439316.1 Salicylate 5-hydroxylase, small oxygenase component [Ralstonia pseudosolanacearum]
MLDFATYQQLLDFYTRYAAAVDNGDWHAWPEFFLDECIYKIQPRENYERGYPLATLSFESKGMLKDRVYGMTETIFHDPYYQRHVISLPQVTRVEGDRIEAQANYAVFRTKPDELSTVFNVGRYIDTIVRTDDGLKLASRLCVFDSEMIPNSIIYPI